MLAITIGVIFIFYIWFTSLLKRYEALTREEKVVTWLGLILFVIGVSFQILEFFSVTPSLLAPYSMYIVFSFILVGAVMLSFLFGQQFPRVSAKSKEIEKNKEATSPQNETERIQFKNKIKQEIQNIANDFYVLSHQKEIPSLLDGVGFSLNEVNYIAWLDRTPDEKARLFGAEHYHILQSFYDTIDERNNYLRTKQKDFEVIKKLNQSCIDTYNKVKREWDDEKGKLKPSFEETRIELLQALHFFPEHWATYRELIKKNELKSPQNTEIKRCSDQIKSAIARARMLNLNEINTIIPHIEALSNEMASFGVAVQQFPRYLAFNYGDRQKVIDDIIARGDTLLEKVKQIISIVKQGFG